MIALILVAATFDEGVALKKQEKFVEAEAVFAQLVREDPQNVKALAQQATLLSWLGKFDAALAAWRRAVELEPDEPDYSVALSRVQYWKGDLGEARTRLDTLLRELKEAAL